MTQSKATLPHKEQQHEELNQQSSQFVDTTMDKLQEVAPISPQYTWWRGVLFAGSISVLSFCAAWLASSYIYDVYESVFVFRDITAIANSFWLGDTLIELLLIALLCMMFAILLYRRTDWPLVRHSTVLVVIVCAIMSVGGGIMVAAAHEEFVSTPKNLISQLPYRQQRMADLQQKLHTKNIAVGVIIDFDQNKNILILESQLGVQEFVIDAQTQLVDIDTITVGKRVIIIFETRQQTQIAREIRPQRQPPLRRQRLLNTQERRIRMRM